MNQEQDERRLESWKEIASYLQRNAKTARNWEKEEGLPVHRHSHKLRSSVYAYPSEIDAWRASRNLISETPTRPWWRPVAIGVTVMLCLMMVGNGIRPQVASAQQAAKSARQIWLPRPNEGPMSVSPDGRYVSYWVGETGDLGIRDMVTRASQRLTNSGGWETTGDFVASDAISPDGRQIAYTWEIMNDLSVELRVIPITGGTPRTVWRRTDGSYLTPADWTPDRKHLLVIHNPPDRTTQLALLSIEDGSMRVIKSLGWRRLRARLSPDGRWIAYDGPVNDKNQARDIFVLAVDGSREFTAVQNQANDSEPVWTPDGTSIVFLSDRTGTNSLWRVPVANAKPGKAELVKADVGRVQFLWMTRTGTVHYSVSARRSFNLHVAELGADMKVSKPPALAVETFVNSNNSPALSPDGRYLAYRSLRKGSDASLVIQTISTGEERVVPLHGPIGNASFGRINWFPDGQSLFAEVRGVQGPGTDFYRINVAAGDSELLYRIRNLTNGAKLSPDGKAIFFTEQDPDSAPAITARLVRFDLETRRETELRKGEWFIDVALSPDSQQLAYLGHLPGGVSYLAVMPASGGDARELYRDAHWLGTERFNTLAWTPERRYLMFVRAGFADSGPSLLWRVPVSGGPAEPVGLSMPGLIVFPQIHSDRKRLFFQANEGGSNELWALENLIPANQEK